ncbi:hypothetical protein [Stutzerimonas chloritidismutans]|jgi:hypothetical protein|nr:hypothetical protein [Stutzerimonas stutzeri]
MNELPDLDRLGHAEKNDLIRALFAQVQALTITPGSPSASASEAGTNRIKMPDRCFLLCIATSCSQVCLS